MGLVTQIPNGRQPAEIMEAAECGEAWAQNWAGVQCWFGDHLPKNPRAAVEWLRKAVMQGDCDAQANLGQLLLKDRAEIPKDKLEAEKLLMRAAENGHAEAQMILGFTRDEAGDFQQAAYWYRRAAEQGHATAQNNLGVLYWSGNGVPKNFVECYKWFNLAAAQGDANAIQDRESVAKKMTRDQIAEAQRLTAAFIPCKESANRTLEPTPESDHQESDVTKRIERLEAFEDRLGVRLEALNGTCFLSAGDNIPYLRVGGEIHALDGSAPKHQFKLVVDAYDSTGRLLNTGWQTFCELESFFAFETFVVQINVIGEVAKVRVYPKRI